MKKGKLLLTTVIALIITFLFNCKYFFAGTEKAANLWFDNQISLNYTSFPFFNGYFDEHYHCVMLWDILAIVLCISFWVCMFLSEHIRKNFYIKNIVKGKTADKIFVIIFLLLLIIPISRFDHRTKSFGENRTLAKIPKLYEINTDDKQTININFNYFKDLDKYINDRFFMRNMLIYINKDIIYHTALRYPHINGRYIDKKTKWLGRYIFPPVYKNKMSAGKYKSFVKGINKGLLDFSKYCNDNNVKFYVLIHPEKVSIYKPDLLKNNNDKDIKEFITEINPDNKINIIFPLDELQKKAKENNTLLYYKTDHHLTPDGYYLVYELTMKEINKTLPKIKILNISEFDTDQSNEVSLGIFDSFNKGSLCDFLTNKSCNLHLNYPYNYYTHKNASKLENERIKNPDLRLYKYKYPAANPQKVLIIGNSHIEGLSNFMPYSFKSVYELRLNAPPEIKAREQYKILKYYDKIIKEYKPDIIILAIDYDNIKELGKIALYE